MCLMAPGRVTAVVDDEAIVDVDGRLRRASTLLEPEVAAGDWVVVAGGTILRLIDAEAAAEMTAAVETIGIGQAKRAARDMA